MVTQAFYLNSWAMGSALVNSGKAREAHAVGRNQELCTEHVMLGMPGRHTSGAVMQALGAGSLDCKEVKLEIQIQALIASN